MSEVPGTFRAVPFPIDGWVPDLRALTAVKPNYLPAGWVRRLTLPAPCPEGIADDCRAVFEAKGLRDQARIQEIQTQAASANSVVAAVQQVVGAMDTPLAHAATAAVVKAVLFDLQPVIFYFKMRFNRGRPWMCCDLDIDPMFPRPHPWYPGHPAYPSGHSTQAHAVAYVYCRMFPQLRDALEKAALRVAQNREVAGLHFPTDTTAGMSLARQFVDLMLEQPAFADLVDIAKAEWPEHALP